jgi:1,4-alpha-glucan branching enzyme
VYRRHLLPDIAGPATVPAQLKDGHEGDRFRGASLRACFISPEYPPRMFGGLGSHVEQLSAALGQHIDLDVVLPSHQPGYSDPPHSHTRLFPLMHSDPSYCLTTSWLDFALEVAGKIDSMIMAGASFDVIHCHDWVTVLAGVRCRWRHNIPLVFHLHLPIPSQLEASIENLGLSCADIVTVNSNSVRAGLLKRSREIGFELDRVEVINNGVDLTVFRPREDWPADDGYILYAGHLERHKGPERLLRAFYHVQLKFPDIRLRIVGNGDLWPHLHRLRASLKIPERQVEFIRTTQWLTRQEMAHHFQGASVVVVPSLYEAFGMVAIEALACQRPVVVSNTGGLAEIVKHNVNGFLAESRDEVDLAQWIMILLADSGLRHRLGVAGRRQLHGEYTWPNIARQFMALYRDLQQPRTRDIPWQAYEFKARIEELAGTGYADLFDWRRP